MLKARPGDANIAKAVVTLPKTQFLEQSHIRTVCEEGEPKKRVTLRFRQS